MQTAIREDIRFDVRRLAELPPLPHTTQRLLDLLGNDDVDIAELADVIEQSPSLAARVVGLARSAYFGHVAGVESVRDAIIKVLGISLVKNIALGIALSGSFDGSRCAGFSIERYWCNALLTAKLARLLTLRARAPLMPAADNAYLCGLLHSIGLLALGRLVPDELGQALTLCTEQPELSLCEAEREVLGTDHAEAGGWLLRRWHLTPEICAAAEHHNEPAYRGPYWQASLLTGLATGWGRQRLAGVADPWVSPEDARALGLDDAVLAAAIEDCDACVDAVEVLARMMAGNQ